MRLANNRTLRYLGFSLAAMGTHCSGGGTQNNASAPSSNEPDPGIAHAALVAGLEKANDCDGLLKGIQRDAIRKVYDQAVALRTKPASGTGFGEATSKGGVIPTADPGVAGDQGSSNSAAPTSPAPPTGLATRDGSSLNASSGDPSGHSETNVQVAGVDEADVVKTDEQGKHLYLLHGQTLYLLDTWPPEATAIRASMPLEGSPQELFVSNGKAVVYSSVYDDGSLRLKATPQGAGIFAPKALCQGCGGGAFTKLTVIDVSSGTPQIIRELYEEGSYTSARRHGDLVRTVVQGGFKAPGLFQASIQYVDPWGNDYPQEEIDRQITDWRVRVEASIRQTTLNDWLPVELEKRGDSIAANAPRCGNYYVPSPGLTDYGLTSVLSLDLSHPEADIGGASILGNAQVVYANASSLLLASNDWRWTLNGIDGQQTVLHRFDIANEATTYTGSGFVPGYIHNQFSIDEAADKTIRLSTTQAVRTHPHADPNSPESFQTTQVNQVLTLKGSGAQLEQIGTTAPLAEGERIFATRFVGDRGYVVTYRQVDPLFVVDLANPVAPKVLGQLHLPGYSDYMQPIDAGHLLTIGRDTTASKGGTTDNGLLLQIFDVSDATAPRQVQKYSYTTAGYSQANQDHKAFTYYGERHLLAFPFTGYSPFASSLEVFKVDSAAGFTKLGSIHHEGLFPASCVGAGYFACNYTPEVRRGLFIDDFVYSISYGGVLAHSLTDLTKPVASVSLPAPVFGNGLNGATDVGVATPPSQGTVPVSSEPAAPPMDAGSASATPSGADAGSAPPPASP